MPLEATQSGAEKIKAFPAPETLDKLSENGEDHDTPVNPRDAAIEAMDEMIQKQREEEIRESGYEIPEEVEPGLNEQERMHAPAPAGDALPEELQNDPLADYIVMDGDQAMFRTKVDGQDRLIPLETAKAQLQKHVAAEIRLQQAAQRNKELDARAEQLRANEAAFEAKRQSEAKSPPPVIADVSDQDFRSEAAGVVKTLFTGSEAEAVESLTALLGKTRQAPGPQVNPQDLVSQAVAATRQELQAERAREQAAARQQDVNTGFQQFSNDYPEIARDANLFRYADGLTDTIAEEHPDWAPSRVMAEAGKQTRDWVASFSAPPSAAPQPSDRHNRKRNLTPMPQPRSAVQPAPAPVEMETPSSFIAEQRRARGQG